MLAVILIKLLTPSSVAATVNGDKITIKEVDDYYARIPEQYQQLITKNDILEQLINEKILLQEASKQDIAITDDEVNTAINSAIQQSGLTQEEFEQRLQEQDLTMDEMVQYYKTQLTIAQLLNKTILAEINSSDQDTLSQAVQLYLNQLKARSQIEIFMSAPSTVEQTTSTTTSENSDVVNCIADYGITGNTIIFIHSNSCPYCKTMMPIVQELEQEGYTFYWAESSDQEARDVVDNCLSDIMGGYVPQFICPATAQEHTGAMSKSDLKEFANGC